MLNHFFQAISEISVADSILQILCVTYYLIFKRLMDKVDYLIEITIL